MGSWPQYNVEGPSHGHHPERSRPDFPLFPLPLVGAGRSRERVFVGVTLMSCTCTLVATHAVLLTIVIQNAMESLRVRLKFIHVL